MPKFRKVTVDDITGMERKHGMNLVR